MTADQTAAALGELVDAGLLTLHGRPCSTCSGFAPHCNDCGHLHDPGVNGCREHTRRHALGQIHIRRVDRDHRIAGWLLAQVGDEMFYPLLPLCKVGYSFGQLAKAIGKLLVELARPGRPVRTAQDGVSGVGVVLGVTHHESPSVARALTRYVAGALLLALRLLQRRAWARRAADSPPRPSGATCRGVDA